VSDWRDINRDSWSFTTELITGSGGGVGEYLTSYALEVGRAPFLNGGISADIQIADRHAAGAGLVCRADEQWTFLAFYTAPSVPGAAATRARLGAWREGVFIPIAVSDEEITLSEGLNRFSLQFSSGNVQGEIVTAAGSTCRLSHCCPHIPFPGHVGVIKLYGAEVAIRDVRIAIDDGPTPAAAPRSLDGYAWDVFVCHSSLDKPAVLALVGDLERHGIRCWLDSEQIAFGDPISQRIEEGLRRSRYIVPCLSSSLTAQARWSRAEYAAYLGAEFSGAPVRVVPLKLDDCADSDIPPLLADKKRVTRSNAVEFADFVKFLKRRG
jgi:hypothetical protein